MIEYIDREKFIKLLVNRDLREISTKTIGECLDKAEAADVVEVVRCKDCKYYVPISEKIGECKDTRTNSTYMNYCGYAERKTNDE